LLLPHEKALRDPTPGTNNDKIPVGFGQIGRHIQKLKDIGRRPKNLFVSKAPLLAVPGYFLGLRTVSLEIRLIVRNQTEAFIVFELHIHHPLGLFLSIFGLYLFILLKRMTSRFEPTLAQIVGPWNRMKLLFVGLIRP